MGISCVKFKGVCTSEPASIKGRSGGGGQGARSSVGTGSKWESRLCLLPRDAASIPSSLKGIQEEESEAGRRGMGRRKLAWKSISANVFSWL